MNARGGFWMWCSDVVKVEPSRMDDVIADHASSSDHSEPIGEGALDEIGPSTAVTV